MFENILGQSSAGQLANDIKNKSLAPAMLFEGPLSTGKGSAALELSRVISCEKDGLWNCTCSACARHRLLLHPDLLCLGRRIFFAEIAAAGDVFTREMQSPPAKILFIRSVRKLLARFNPVLWEDEPKFKKLGGLVLSLEEDLDEVDALKTGTLNENNETAGKLIASIIKDAYKLESDGISTTVPIEQIRRASSWCHLTPFGKGKLLLLENADTMKEGARNSLLKLLEEPPVSVTVVLTSARPNALMQTILSRLRPYSFKARSEDTEKEVLRRVFRIGAPVLEPQKASVSPARSGLINAYLDSFMPVSGNTLRVLAAYFAASAAFKAALLVRKKGAELPAELVLLGKLSAPLAEEAGFAKSRESRETAAKIMEAASGFEVRSMFSDFCGFLLAVITESLKKSPAHLPSSFLFMELWRAHIHETEKAVMTYNQNISLALERLFIDLSRGMAEI